jgi:hypothetical protein
VTGVLTVMRRRRLRQRFDQEYRRLAGERDSRLTAGTGLAGRGQPAAGTGIRPLTAPARAGYADQWADIQERFAGAPADALAASQALAVAVLSQRAYPAQHHGQMLADRSVEHAETLDHYRAAEEISQDAAAGAASPEDLRQGMLHYRAVFGDLLSAPADAGHASAAAA